VDQSLVLSAIVGRLVVDLQDIFQVITLERDEECACSLKVQGTIEVHLPVLRFFRRWGLLGLRPLRDEVCEDLGLDGMSWIELKLEFAKLDRPLDDVPHVVTAVEDFSQREARDNLDLVRLEVIPQLV
jgi:hypothetical protein